MNIEKAAVIQHRIWSHWMRWMLEKTGARVNSHWVMTNADEQRWRRQMNTEYVDLSPEEKESDRKVCREHGIEELMRECYRTGVEAMRDAVKEDVIWPYRMLYEDVDKVADKLLKENE